MLKALFYLKLGILTEMLVYEDMTACTHLAHHHVINQIATFCHCSVIALATNYTHVPSISIEQSYEAIHTVPDRLMVCRCGDANNGTRVSITHDLLLRVLLAT